jgi:hypothetical protein
VWAQRNGYGLSEGWTRAKHRAGEERTCLIGRACGAFERLKKRGRDMQIEQIGEIDWTESERKKVFMGFDQGS